MIEKAQESEVLGAYSCAAPDGAELLRANGSTDMKTQDALLRISGAL